MGTFRRAGLVPGLYDELISVAVGDQLDDLDTTEYAIEVKQVEKSMDVTSPVATLLRGALDLALEELGPGSENTLGLAEDVLKTLARHAPKAFKDGEAQLRPERLLAIARNPQQPPKRPRGSLHASSLIVNAEGESLLDHLRSEFESADSIDLLCAFVKLSGFEKLRAVLERHCYRGRRLRVLTTTYMGASDALAIEKLARLPSSEVRVSYDDQTTRLHAKAWIFHRASGLSTAYVGSSNLSHAAQTDGLEWNVRIAEADQPAVASQMAETFEQYWADRALFEPFDAAQAPQRERLRRSLATAERDPGIQALVELEAKPFQKPVLEELAAARALGRRRNLLVAATGTGKTVMAALDYAALREDRKVDTLLFVAHRREILEQARAIYRAALQAPGFGELLCQGERPGVGHHVFASIDSLRDDPIDPKAFDIVVIDEAHHAPAFKWESFLDKVGTHAEVLGLTGTPERADGIDYDHLFPRPWIGNLRLWNAIPHALVPFRYYMLDVEGVDLSDVAWVAGRYAPEELAGKLVGAAEIFVERAVRAVAEHIARPETLRAIAFCANVRHAEEVSRQLANRGFRTKVLTGNTPTDERRRARGELNLGEIQVLCVVDIYNEGVDVPNVNTIFFFRPTESPTVFLQQLGRGLRLARNKAELVVFDLTGRQHHDFRFDRRFRQMLGTTPRELREGVEHGFARLPAGCHLQLDQVSRQRVLAQLKHSIPDRLDELRNLLREPAHRDLSLDAFVVETEVELDTIYRQGRSWTELRRSVGLEERRLAEGEEEALTRVCKLTHVGDHRRLDTWRKLASLERARSVVEERVQNMLFAVLYGHELAASGEAWQRWSRHALLREELAAMIPVLARENASLAPDRPLEPGNPLALHGRYLGVELSAAFDQRTKDGHFREFYTGVEAVAGGRYDLLLVTLEKGAQKKEHLRYRDFPLSERRFHWQSKAGTTRASKQGRRHIDPEREHCTPLLFVRERADERPGVTMAFRYLGRVRPAGPPQGERPITVEWELESPMPPELVRTGRIA